MKTGIFLSATASLMLLSSTAVFAQQYAAPNAITLKPGQAASPVTETTTQVAVPQPVGLVTLKPGETVATAGNQDFGSVKAGATQEPAGSFQLLEPGQAG
jgi:hypothetical protein